MNTEKNEAAVSLGRLGGLARRKWTPEQRSEAARKASHARRSYKEKHPDTK